jgi:hypothetical protein
MPKSNLKSSTDKSFKFSKNQVWEMKTACRCIVRILNSSNASGYILDQKQFERLCAFFDRIHHILGIHRF